MAGLAALGNSDLEKKGLNGEQDRMISFDASRISPTHQIDVSQANINNTMLRQLEDGVGKAWTHSGLDDDALEMSARIKTK